MHFLVDFENVHSSGLRGCDMLLYTDRVTLFYSDAASRVENGYIQHIIHAGAKLTAFKLKSVGKNALDFYIATYLGEVFGRGDEGPAAIISNDGGFQATVEFWKDHTPARDVIVATSILEALKKTGSVATLSSDEKDRSIAAEDRLRAVKIGEVCATYGASRKKRLVLMERTGVDYCTADKAIGLVETGQSGRELYNSLVKMMGRAAGQEVYNAVSNKCE